MGEYRSERITEASHLSECSKCAWYSKINGTEKENQAWMKCVWAMII